MELSPVPTFVLQMLSFGSARAKIEVDARLGERTIACRKLLEHGEIELLESLRRCEKMAVWIVVLMACVGAVVGWFAQDPVVGIIGVGLGLLTGSWLAGVMVDNVHALARLVIEGRDAVAGKPQKL